MYWFTRNTWKVGIAIAGILLFLFLLIGIPSLSVSAQGIRREAVTPTVQATPTVDTTITALTKEQLTLQVKQLQIQLSNQNNWFTNNATAFIAAFATIVVALFGISQWAVNRRDERQKQVVAQDKELRDRAEDRFNTAVTALGNDREGTQVGGAILLRSFLNRGDQIYERYYSQIFDLAVSYLRLPRTPQQPVSPEEALPLTTLSQVLAVVFKEAFQRARDSMASNKESEKEEAVYQHVTWGDEEIARYMGKAIEFLDATGVQLDNAYLVLADLRRAWMRNASLRKADLRGADLRESLLSDADLRGADLRKADLSGAVLRKANLSGARLTDTILNEAYLSEANLCRAHLHDTDLSGARLRDVDMRNSYLRGVNLTNAYLRKADLRGATGLTKEQLEACKAKGAIIDEDMPTDHPQDSAPPEQPSQTALE